MLEAKTLKKEFNNRVAVARCTIKSLYLRHVDDVLNKGMEQYMQEFKISVPKNMRDTIKTKCDAILKKFDAKTGRRIWNDAMNEVREELHRHGWELTGDQSCIIEWNGDN